MGERATVAQLPDDAVDEPVVVDRAPVGDRGDGGALALDEAGHGLVDRVGGQQVPGGDGVALADAVTAVLGLVVHRRRPFELQEGDVGRPGQRDPLGRHAGGADDEAVPGPAIGLLEGADGGLAPLQRVLAEEMQRVREAGHHRLLDLDVAGEHHQWLLGGEEVLDPRQRRGQLAAGGQALQGAELGQALRAQGGGDLGVELGEVQRLGAQPGDDVALGQPVLGLVVERHRDDHLALGRQLGEDLGLEPAHEAGAAHVPVQPLLGDHAAELAGEARAGAELLHAPDDAQLRDELLGVVEHRGPAQRQAQAAGRDGRRQPAHRLGALGLGVLAVVRLVDDERARPLARERPVMRGDHLVVDDRDLGRRRDRAAPVDHGDGAVRQPALGLALPAELHRGRADDDRRVGAVGLQGGQRLDGLAQSLLVGQERAAGLQRVADRGPLKRRGLAAEDGRGLGERLGLGGARAPDGIGGVAVLGQQAAPARRPPLR